MRVVTAQCGDKQRGLCDVCGLPDVHHLRTRDCVLALRRECDHLRSRLEEPLAEDVTWLCQVCSCIGSSLLALGALCSAGRTFAYLALALPLSELPNATGFLGGMAAMLAGAFLVSAAHRRHVSGWLRYPQATVKLGNGQEGRPHRVGAGIDGAGRTQATR